MGKIDDNKWQVIGADHIVAIAKQKKYEVWRTLWTAGNLKSKRANPFILFHGDANPKLKHTEGGKEVRGAAGDVLKAPDASPGKKPAKVDANTSFKKSNEKIFLRLRVFDHGMQPLPAEATWKLVIGGIQYPRPAASEASASPASTGGAGGGEPPAADGAFEAGGLINVELKPDTDWSAAGTLFVKYPAPKPKEESGKAETGASTSATGSTSATTAASGSAASSGSGGTASSGATASTAPAPATPKMIEVRFKLTIGRLDPIQETAPDERCTSGVQQRLNNMGFNCGPVDGAVGPITNGAITRFQRMFEGKVTKKPDAATQADLHKFHDRPAKPPTQKVDASEKGATAGDVGSAAGAGGSDGKRKLSGRSWVQWTDEYSTHSKPISELSTDFAGKVLPFVLDLTKFGARLEYLTVSKSVERAYLCHWAWQVAHEKCKPYEVPAQDGVDIDWDHGDTAASIAAAKEMVDDYYLTVPPKTKVAPPLGPLSGGNIVGLRITWDKLKIKRAGKPDRVIRTKPADGGNADLHALAATYGIKKVSSDAIHWTQ